MRSLLLAAAVATLIPSLPAHGADFTAAHPVWNQPVKPFTIAGNLHYVGAAGVSSFLITTEDGHILVDSGFRETVPQIERNMQTLGFELADVRLLLINHAHYDHVGGMADLKARTGARLLAHPADAAALERGGAGDFAFGDALLFPPVKADAEVRDGETIALGGTTLVAHHTPGHTRGSTSWSLSVADGDRTYRVLIVSSLSAPDYSLVNPPAYPGIVRDFETSFAKLRALPCDIVLSAHGWEFRLAEKRAALAEQSEAHPFVDAGELVRLVDAAESRLRGQIEEQQAKVGAP